MASTKTRAHTPTEAHIQSYAERLLRTHGLTNWSVEFDTSVRRFGVCRYSTRTISFSRRLIGAANLEESLDTVRHEVAHAIVGYGHGHGPVWKKKCVELGGKPDRCWDANKVDRSKVGYRYVGKCANGHESYLSRLPKSGIYVCTQCRKAGEPHGRTLIVFTDTKTRERMIIHRNNYVRPSVVFGAAKTA